MKFEKSTDEFENDLKEMKDKDELNGHLAQLDKIEAGRYLQRLMDEKGISVNQLVHCINTSHSNLYKFMSGEKNGSRDLIIRVACAIGMSVEETNCLLKYAGFRHLYAKDKRDSLILYGLERKMSVNEIEELLVEHEIDFHLC